MNWIEIVGYISSVLIALSLTMNNIWRLRWINSAGAGLMSIYGLLIGSIPVCGLNAFIFCVNLYYLYGMVRQTDSFSLLAIRPDSPYLDRFLDYYQADLVGHFPRLKETLSQADTRYFILRNMMPAGLFAYRTHDATVEILIDYVTPDYRDFKNAHFVFSAYTADLRQQGYREFVAVSDVPVHQKYLRRFGFQADAQQPTTFRKAIV